MNNPFIIGEVGINANGSLDIAKQLIAVAKEAGADAVKFQKRTIELCYTPEFLALPRESPWGKTQRDQKEGLEFSFEEYGEIDRYCRELGIDWFASAWDLPSQHFLKRFNLKYNKIASPMITNEALLKKVAQERKPTFISTGLGKGLNEAVAIFRQHNCPFTIMHTVAGKKTDLMYFDRYLTYDNEVRLSEIKRLKDAYNVPVGFSCHSYSLLVPVLAVAMGAEALEVHICLDRASYGTDMVCSFEPEGLRRIVRDARRVREILK